MTSPRKEIGPWPRVAAMPVTPPPSRDPAPHVNTLKVEAELRHAVIDRMIAAGLSQSGPALEATLERWRAISTQNTGPAGPEAG